MQGFARAHVCRSSYPLTPSQSIRPVGCPGPPVEWAYLRFSSSYQGSRYFRSPLIGAFAPLLPTLPLSTPPLFSLLLLATGGPGHPTGRIDWDGISGYDDLHT
eukprot:302648-Hanusia_phi.AAC.1